MLIQLILHIVGYDLWFYLSHLALHTPTLWWIHRIHHEKRKPLWYDTYHGHWLESAIQGLGFFLPWLDMNVSLPVAAVALLLINVRAMAQHDKRCAWIVGDHHLVHHRNARINFGQPWLDWLGGTNY